MTERLGDVLAKQGCDLSDRCIGLLERYCELLWIWNQRLNLTRHTDFETFVTRDLHDSQHLASQIRDEESVLDMGAGGGVPGIVMAILRPDLRITLAESTKRKAVALEDIIDNLELRVPVLAERAEEVLRTRSFDTVTARAVAPLKKLLPLLKPVRHSFGRLLLIKGPNWVHERAASTATGALRGVSLEPLVEYSTTGRDGQSVVLQVTAR